MRKTITTKANVEKAVSVVEGAERILVRLEKTFPVLDAPHILVCDFRRNLVGLRVVYLPLLPARLAERIAEGL